MLESITNAVHQLTCKQYEPAMWIKVHFAFAMVRATNLCFRGSLVHWRSGTGIDDGAGLPYVSLA